MADKKQLILVVEGTAALGPYWRTIVSDYLEKVIRYSYGRILDLGISNYMFMGSEQAMFIQIETHSSPSVIVSLWLYGGGSQTWTTSPTVNKLFQPTCFQAICIFRLRSDITTTPNNIPNPNANPIPISISTVFHTHNRKSFEKQWASAESEASLLKKTNVTFQDDMLKPFKFIHVWEVVKRSIRWKELATHEDIANPPKRSRTSSYSSS
uniref:Mediator of RNA polymerase II transcription subunit 25 von Willebrand factor type A domain-containing protein n=1 Tax=Lactuca sativa TaxID=4236 RepID=A0A9R1XLS2_LACSA|nr:hypothetical protein LSAT_V11C400164300 [Lactuca sativa]